MTYGINFREREREERQRERGEKERDRERKEGGREREGMGGVIFWFSLSIT